MCMIVVVCFDVCVTVCACLCACGSGSWFAYVYACPRIYVVLCKWVCRCVFGCLLRSNCAFARACVCFCVCVSVCIWLRWCVCVCASPACSCYPPTHQMKTNKLKGHGCAVTCMDAWQDVPTLGCDAPSRDSFKSLKEALSYCKLRILSGGVDGRVCMWEGRKGKLVKRVAAHTSGE